MSDEPKFICDANVGKLGKWLRIVGVDATFLDPRRDEELILLARREGRIILTTDSGIASRPYVERCLLIKSRDYREQLKEVCDAFGLQLSPARVFSRCIECNRPVEPAAKGDIEGRVAEHVLAEHDEFFLCPSCGRVYWPGTHLRNTLESLRSMGVLAEG